MKRIIDIDEEEYNRIRHFCSSSDNNIPLGWYEIAKSKPLQTELEEIKAKIEGYKSTIDIAISEDELKIEGMKEAYSDSLEIIDKCIVELKGDK